MQSNHITPTVIAVLGASLMAIVPAEAGLLFSTARNAAARKATQSAVVKQAVAQPAKVQGKPHDIVIQRSRHPQAAQHIDDAQRQGQPSVVYIAREGAAQRRAASTGSVNRFRKPEPMYERDEYPPAFTSSGGRNANVRYIHRFDNRGAGAVMGAQARGLPDGTKIRIVVSD